MGITVTGLDKVRTGRLDAAADSFRSSAKKFGSGEEDFRSGVADRIGSGDIWSGGGQSEANTVMQTNLGALTIAQIQMEAAETTMRAFHVAIRSAQKVVRKALDDVATKEFGIHENGDVYNSGTYGEEDADTLKIEERVKGAIAFAAIADASCKELLDRITAHVFTYSPTADEQALQHNAGVIDDAIADRKLAGTVFEFWDAAYPKPLHQPGAHEQIAGEVGDFFGALWDNPAETIKLIGSAGETALGLLGAYFGITGVAGGAAVAVAGGGIVGVGAAGLAGGLTVAGLAAAAHGADGVAKSIDELASKADDSSTGGGSTPTPPTSKSGRTADDLSGSISDGHAYTKHVEKKNEFPEVSSKGEFKSLVKDVIENGQAKFLSNDRVAYWKDDTVVIYNPKDPDAGTAFKPKAGKSYFDDLH